VKPRVLALFAHPDDVEFRAAGTLALLGAVGWELHYATVTAGDLGALRGTRAQIAATRRREAKAAAKALGAKWHPPFGSDMQVVYSVVLLRRAAALVRKVAPTILLTHPPVDYMEDHTQTCRLAVSAAFIRGAPLFRTTPPRPHVSADIAVYHSTPHGLVGPLGEPRRPAFLVDTASVHTTKLAALALHNSQLEWLDATQGEGSYVAAADRESRALAQLVPHLHHAEGWTQHHPLGFGALGSNPLGAALAGHVHLPVD